MTSKFKLANNSKNYSSKVIDKLETIDIEKIDIIMLQIDGCLEDSPLKYSDLKNKELVKEVIKKIEDIDIQEEQIKIYDKPTLTLVGEMSNYSFRLYFGEIPIGNDGDYIDFCLDCIPENEEDFEYFINKWK